MPEDIPKEGEVITGSEILDLERQRIQVSDRKNDVMLEAIKAQDLADKRQFDYHMQCQSDNTEHRRTNQITATRLLWAISLSGGLIIFSLMAASLSGEPALSSKASELLSTLFKAVGGAGAFILLRNIFRRLTS
jgi:hypothetical protein